ncbi:DUF3514 domain-containing protein [Ehrlichia sp. JZT12]
MLIELCIGMGVSIIIASATGLIGLMDNSDNSEDNSGLKKKKLGNKRITGKRFEKSSRKRNFSKNDNTLVLSTKKVEKISKPDLYNTGDEKIGQRVRVYEHSESAEESGKCSSNRGLMKDVMSQHKTKLKSSSELVSTPLPNTESTPASELQDQYLYQGARPKMRFSSSHQSYSRSSEVKDQGEDDLIKVLQMQESNTRRRFFKKDIGNYEEQIVSGLNSLQLTDTLHDQAMKEDIGEGKVVENIQSIVDSQLSGDIVTEILYSACGEGVQRDDLVNDMVIPVTRTSDMSPPSGYISGSLNISDIFQNKQESTQDGKHLVMVEVTRGFQGQGVLKRLPNIMYRKKQSFFTSMLKEFKDMHFYCCVDVIRSVFYVYNDFICIHEDSLLFLMGSTQYYELCLSVLKVSCMVQFSSMFNIPKVANGFIYNFKLFKNSREFDIEFIKMINCLQNEYQNLREAVVCLYKSRDYVSFYMQSREILPPSFFDDLLKMLCDFVSLRLTCNNYCTTSLIDFIIVSTAMVIGTMYANYKYMFNSRSDSRIIEGFFDLIDAMGMKSVCRGNLGLACHNILKIFLHMYNSNNNDLRIIGNMYFPRVLMQKCSPFFFSKVERNINSGTMSFNVVLEDLSLVICGLVDKCNVMAFSREILAYSMIYSQLSDETTVHEEKDTLNTSKSNGRSL